MSRDILFFLKVSEMSRGRPLSYTDSFFKLDFLIGDGLFHFYLVAKLMLAVDDYLFKKDC